MSKEIKIILFIAISMIINIIAPIMCINTVRDYTRTSEIVGSPSNEIVISEFVPVENYVFQENLSKINFVADEETGYFLYSYYFSAKDFDSSKHNYSIFINDYALTITSLQNKAISGQYKMNFKDISGNILNTVTIDITFEFYSSYSYLFLKIDTTDITYFNGFRENPGFVLTLSSIDYGMNGLIFDSNEDVSSQIEPSYTATFMVNDELYAVKTVKESENYVLTLPTKPTKDGYYFAGWSLDGVNVVHFDFYEWTEDITLVSIFTDSVSGSLEETPSSILKYDQCGFTGTINDTSYTIVFSESKFCYKTSNYEDECTFYKSVKSYANTIYYSGTLYYVLTVEYEDGSVFHVTDDNRVFVYNIAEEYLGNVYEMSQTLIMWQERV